MPRVGDGVQRLTRAGPSEDAGCSPGRAGEHGGQHANRDQGPGAPPRCRARERVLARPPVAGPTITDAVSRPRVRGGSPLASAARRGGSGRQQPWPAPSSWTITTLGSGCRTTSLPFSRLENECQAVDIASQPFISCPTWTFSPYGHGVHAAFCLDSGSCSSACVAEVGPP